MSVVFKREFKAYFTTPIGFIVIAALVMYFGNFYFI